MSRPTASAATGSVTVKANIVYQHNRKLRGAPRAASCTPHAQWRRTPALRLDRPACACAVVQHAS